MFSKTYQGDASRRERPSAGTATSGTGRDVVAVLLAYVLILYQLPLVPLLVYTLALSGHVRGHCTDGICYCQSEHGSAHHHADHTHPRSPANPSWSACGAPGATAAFLLPVLTKALFFETSPPQPHGHPPLMFAGRRPVVFSQLIQDVFHPPRPLSA